MYINTCFHAYIPANQQTNGNKLHAYINACIRAHMHTCDTCTCMYHLHTCMHTYMRIYTFLNLQHLLIFFLLPPRWAIHMCIYAYAYVYTHMHTCVPAHQRTCIRSTYTYYTYTTHTRITRMHACIHTTHAQIPTWLHTCMHTPVYTHMHNAYILTS